jgi:hypothetical protein
MYLFSRSARLAGGNTRDEMAWATGITELVNKITGIGTSLFARVYSPGAGTLVWSSFLPDLASLEAAGDKLQGDDKFVAMADKGAKMTDGGLDDTLGQVLSGDPDPTRAIEYVTVVQAVCASGKVGRGLEVGIELSKRVEKITGTPSLFVSNVTGPYGGVGWASAYANVQAMEAAQEALASDAEWIKYVDREVVGVYAEEPAMTTQLVLRRIV